jgi:hypothetical protein
VLATFARHGFEAAAVIGQVGPRLDTPGQGRLVVG